MEGKILKKNKTSFPTLSITPCLVCLFKMTLIAKHVIDFFNRFDSFNIKMPQPIGSHSVYAVGYPQCAVEILNSLMSNS